MGAIPLHEPFSDSRPDYKIRAQGSDPTTDSCAEPRITPHSPTAGKSHGSSTDAPHAVARRLA